MCMCVYKHPMQITHICKLTYLCYTLEVLRDTSAHLSCARRSAYQLYIKACRKCAGK